MRCIWARTLGVFLSLGAFAHAQQPMAPRTPAATLGRPVPAATLGLPIAADEYTEPLQRAGYTNNARPVDMMPVDNSMPLLAPITSGDNPPGKPMPSSDGAPLPAPLPTPSGPAATQPAASGPTQGAPCANCGQGYAGQSPAMAAFGPAAWGDGFWASQFYSSAEFLLWWTPSGHVPTLAVTTPVLPTAANPFPQPQTVVAGNSGLYPTDRYGGRFGLGFWFSPAQIRGIDTNFFFLGTTVTDVTLASNLNGSPNISRPFINAATGAPALEIVSGTGFSTGSLHIQGESSFYGGDVNYRRNLCGACGCPDRIDALVGFRYMHLNETLTITESFATLPGATTNFGVPATQGTVVDRFTTLNNFYGPQFGLIGERHWGPWSIEAMAKIAMGATASTVNINGYQNVSIGGAMSTDPRPGGLLALSSNIGTWHHTSFAVVPEAGVNVGYQLTPRIKLFVGYSFIYWSSVLRPGDQIDPRLDVNRIPNFIVPPAAPTTPHPQPTLTRTDYWAQGISFGVQVRW